MSEIVKNIYKKSRMRASITQEMAAELLNMSVRQLGRYESGEANPSDDVVGSMMTVYEDEYLGYLYLLDDTVGQSFLPREVERCSMLEAVVMTSLAAKEFVENIDHMMKSAIDGKITDDEIKEWLNSKGKLKKVVAGYIAIECADGEI